MEHTYIIKVKVGKWIIPVNLSKETEARLKLKFPYNPALIEEIKSMAGARWNPEEKAWYIIDNEHNWFQLNYLQHCANKEHPNPYELYDRPLVEWFSTSGRQLFEHQILGVRQVLTRKRTVLAYDTGIGKTLIAIEVLEELLKTGKLEQPLGGSIVWVGPRSGLVAVQYEFMKWKVNSDITNNVQWFTYDALKRYCKSASELGNNWKVPTIVIFDEAQKIRNPTAQRSQAADWLADKVRKENGYIIEMSGTPSPHSPLDWWHLSEVAAPGFLKEGDIRKFQRRLSCVRMETNNVTGGMYPKLITWFDDTKKCAICGKLKEDFNHDPEGLVMGSSDNEYHIFKPSKDEVSYLYERLKGLVIVRLKKDVLKELPEKVYREINIQPSASILRMAKLITNTAKSTIQALTLLRELSDGFQYKEELGNSKIVCQLCNGKKTINASLVGGIGSIDCTKCSGTGWMNEIVRTTVEVECPKDGIIIDLLEEYEESGRVILYSAFTAGIDRLVRLVAKTGWHWIRVDGRGWHSDMMDTRDAKGMLQIFQEERKVFDKVAYIGNPESGGIAVTLTASPVEIYLDNSFHYEHREQSENRGHRPGMDLNKGLTIIDLFHLPVDRKVKENLDKKKVLEKMTLGEILEGTESTGARRYI